MKLMGLCLLAAVCYAGGSPRIQQLAPVTLFTQFQQPPQQAVIEALQAEAENILAPAGFRLDWHDITAASTVGTVTELAVVTFRGRCGANEGVPRIPSPQLVLGFTSVTDGAILPFITVDCDRARGFLANALFRLADSERRRIFGRALGRILAHELYHVFANTMRHGPTGVAKNAYSVSDLMGEEFSFEEREFEMLRAARPPTAPPGVTPPTAAADGTR